MRQYRASTLAIIGATFVVVLTTTAGVVTSPPPSVGPAVSTGGAPRNSTPSAPKISNGAPIDDSGVTLPTAAEAAASKLMRYFESNPTLPLSDVRIDGSVISVLYKGQVPADVRSQVANSAVPIRFIEAKYSRQELAIEARRVAESNQNTVASAGPASDYSGLVIEQFPAAASQRAAAPRSTVPLTIQGISDPAAAARNGDSAPFYGGALIFMPTTSDTYGIACTSGWPVFNAGVSGLTTAFHCGIGNPWRGYDSGLTIGTVNQRNQGRDIQVIGGNSAPKVYVGPWNSNTSRGIYNAERPANNSGICLGGGVMGERCNKVYVRGTNITVNVSGVGTVGPGYWALNEDIVGGVQQGIARGGDSGGPSYSYISTSQVSAKGSIIAIDKTFSTSGCGQQHPNFAPPCYSRAFMVNAVDAFQSVGSTLRTGP